MSEMNHSSASNRHLQQQQQQHSASQLQQMQHLNNLRRAPPTMPRPPPSQRLPENINQINRPTDKSAATRQATNNIVNPRNLPPPSGVPPTSSHLRPSSFPHHVSPQQQQQRNMSPSMPYPHHNNQHQQQHQQQQQQQNLYGGAPDVTLPSSASSRLKQAGKSLPKLGPDVSFLTLNIYCLSSRDGKFLLSLID